VVPAQWCQPLCTGELKFDDAKKKVVEAHQEVLPSSDGKPCDASCLEKQIEASVAKSQTDEIEVRRKDGKTSKNYPLPDTRVAEWVGQTHRDEL
jgi:hypothetical protein